MKGKDAIPKRIKQAVPVTENCFEGEENVMKIATLQATERNTGACW